MKQVRTQTVLNIAVSDDMGRAAKELEAHPLVESVVSREDDLLVTLKPDAGEYSDLAAMLVHDGHKLMLFREDELNLETAFMALTKGITA